MITSACVYQYTKQTCCQDLSYKYWRTKRKFRVHEDASQGMYMSKIEICFFTARILQNQRMLYCGECFHD
jgi:hypothetical protein